MTRGEATQRKVHFQGRNDDFLVFVDDVEQYKKWSKGDATIPLAQFVSTFKVFQTHKQGTQGTYDAAPKSILAAEFDTEDLDEVIKKILKDGSMQTVEMPARQGVTNDSMSSMKTR